MDYIIGLVVLAATGYIGYQLGRQDAKETHEPQRRFRHRRRR